MERFKVERVMGIGEERRYLKTREKERVLASTFQSPPTLALAFSPRLFTAPLVLAHYEEKQY